MITDPKFTTLVKRRHPEYEARLEHWDFLEACYEGGRDWFADNIFRYLKEGDKEFNDRVVRAYRFNHTREVVDLLDKYLFRAQTTRNDVDAPQSVKDFWESSTRAGSPITSLVKRVSKSSSTFGRMYVVVDTSAGANAISLADAVKLNAKTYAYIVKPQDVLDLSFDDQGDLNWILIREYGRDDINPFGEAQATHERFRLWTKSEWTLYRETPEKNAEGDIRIEQIGYGVHGLGIVPVIPAAPVGICTSSSTMWLSVPPLVIRKPLSMRHSASFFAFFRICPWYSRNSGVSASLKATALAAMTCIKGPPCIPGKMFLLTAAACAVLHMIIPPRGPRSVLWVVVVTRSQ